jgi:hypothetical protein
VYKAGDAAHVILNFGQYRGATLVQVAQTDPDYVHQLALTAAARGARRAAAECVRPRSHASALADGTLGGATVERAILPARPRKERGSLPQPGAG